MRVKIIETCVYEVDACNADAAERLFLEDGPLGHHVEFKGVTERHVIELSDEQMNGEVHRFANVVPFKPPTPGPVSA